MRGGIALAMLLAGGCDSILGLRATAPADARYLFFDAPIDAPFACPPTGMRPTFSAYFHQIVLTGGCEYYSTTTPAANLAVARCPGGVWNAPIWFVAQSGLEPTPAMNPATLALAGAALQSVKIAPDGGELWATRSSGTTGTISVYTQAGPASWAWSYDAFTPVDPGSGVSAPTRAGGSPRHVVYMQTTTIEELAETAPRTWTQVASYTASQLGVSAFGYPLDVNLTPDGLHMVFPALVGATYSPAVAYTARAGVNDSFGPASALDGPPSQAVTPFLAEDCGQLYFSGLGSVWSVEQVGYE